MSNYTEKGVNFTVGEVGIFTTGMKIARANYQTDANENILVPQKVINAIDIDWNKAKIPGVTGEITSTAELLKLIGDIKSTPNETIKHVFLEPEEYEALQEYSDNTIYFILGDGNYNGGNGGNNGNNNEQEEYIFDNLITNLKVSYIENNNTVEHTYTDNDLVNGILSLQPQRKYTISGSLRGSIEIDTANGTTIVNGSPQLNGDTELVLNNVKILASSENYGILYTIPSGSKKQKALKITLKQNSKNYIYCSQEQEITSSQPGAIYSKNNLVIQGSGYLSIQNNGGHGVRGEEFILCGPHMWINANHDGIHGKQVHIIGGIYYITGCKDGIGTNDTGHIYYYDGTFIFNNISEKYIDSKRAGFYFNNDLLSNTDLEHCQNMTYFDNNNGYITGKVFGITAEDKGNLQPSVIQDWTNNNAKLHEISLNETSNTYVVPNEYPYILIRGNISNSIVFNSTNFGTNNNDDATVYLDNACINVNVNKPVLQYDGSQGKIKILSLPNTINVIRNTYVSSGLDATQFLGDAIKSENNIGIEIKSDSYLYISSASSDGIDGGEVKINDSLGNLIVSKCGQRGIKGNAIVIGPEANISQSNIESYAAVGSPDYKTFDGICYVKNNCTKFLPEIVHGNPPTDTNNSGFADIYARNGKYANKGQFGTQNKELNGVIITGTMGAIVKIDMGNAENLYYNSIVTADEGVSNPIPSNGIPIIINDDEVDATIESLQYISFIV